MFYLSYANRFLFYGQNQKITIYRDDNSVNIL